MSKRKIYVVGSDGSYANWMKGEIVRNMEDATLVVFTGGSDIDPMLYGKQSHPTTSSYPMRDKWEVVEFNKAKELGKAMIGICRGSQFLCVVNGGILVQHQQHPYLHEIATNDGRKFITTSTHHQRAYIKGLGDKAQLIAWAEHLSPFSYGENNEDVMDEEKEAEIVFYPETRSLGIQGHPEIAYPPKEEWEAGLINYCRELIKKYLEV